MNKSNPSFNDMKKHEELEKSSDLGAGRPKSLMGYGTKKERPMSPSQRMFINSKSAESGRQNTDGAAQQAGATAAKERRMQMRKEGLIKERPSYNDMKKNEETLEKTGTMTKLALAAALAGPVLSSHKGTLFEDSKAPVTREIAGQPAHEKDPEEIHTELSDGVTHVSKPASYSITHKVSDKPTAASMKAKFKDIRNKIKGNENGIM